MKNLKSLAERLKSWGIELGFQQIGIASIHKEDVTLAAHQRYFEKWLENNHHGEMQYMANHQAIRQDISGLLTNTLSVITARMDYLPENTNPIENLSQTDKAYIARYALGRDYHKVMRKKLKLLGEKLTAEITDTQYRVCVDSAPLLEKALAEKSGLGWIGKNSLVINQKAGSWFFLGEILTNLPLPADAPASFHCGSCEACIKVCPTDAIIAPFQIDARKCIAYLTIEYKGSIPFELREKMGNRIFGCDDCQLFCPWNRFAKSTTEADYQPRHSLDNNELLTLFLWDEDTFLKKTEGSPIRRTGYTGWLRNIAVGLGNAPYDTRILNALITKKESTNILVQEHIDWAIQQQEKKKLALDSVSTIVRIDQTALHDD